MEQNMQFRSAGFGGFNRQDVLNYIEETTKEYNQKLDELRTQYEAAQAEREELRQALSESKNQEENLQNRVEELLQEKNALLTRVKKLEPLQAQVTLLHSRVEALTPDAEAYAGLRSQISDIELEARQRASEILAQAKQKAEEITTSAQSQADALRSQTETAAEEQLTQARAQAEDIVTQANQSAAAATTEAQHQVEAEQERVQDLRSKTQSALAETGAVVRSIVVNSVAEIERIKDALMTLKATYSQAQDDLTHEAPAETPEEPKDE